MIENKVIYSIIHKQPKRADHYWLFHFEYVDEPETLEYTFEPLIEDTLFRINVRIGFRVQPFLTVYLRKVIEDLVAEKKFNIISGYKSLAKRNMAGDFRFIIVHRIFYAASSKNKMQNFMMMLYAIIKHIGIPDVKSLGLDTSNTTVENVPLIVNHISRHIHTLKKQEKV